MKHKISYNKKKLYRTLFISDVHLGSRISKPEFFLSFLKEVEVEKIYLVGDFIDFSSMKKKPFWTDECNLIIRRLLRLNKHGVKIVYIIGNHDEGVRHLEGEHLGDIDIKSRDVHVMITGKRLSVLHGHHLDAIFAAKMFVIYRLGDLSYNIMNRLNIFFSYFLRVLGKTEFSLSHFIRSKVSNVTSFINQFETMLINEAKRENFAGIVAGHIHKAELKKEDGIIYGNCGSWTDKMTFLAENYNGRLELLEYPFDYNQKKEESRKRQKNRDENNIGMKAGSYC